jgi:hypothetical protein
MNDQTTSKWQTAIINTSNTLAEEFGLDDLASQKLRESVMTIAREQYKAGNRSGIKWARTTPPKTVQTSA